jgi:hypothetical protein
MPIDAMMVSVAVVVVFAAVLLWANFQTRPDRLKAASNRQKRRSF